MPTARKAFVEGMVGVKTIVNNYPVIKSQAALHASS